MHGAQKWTCLRVLFARLQSHGPCIPPCRLELVWGPGVHLGGPGGPWAHESAMGFRPYISHQSRGLNVASAIARPWFLALVPTGARAYPALSVSVFFFLFQIMTGCFNQPKLCLFTKVLTEIPSTQAPTATELSKLGCQDSIYSLGPQWYTQHDLQSPPFPHWRCSRVHHWPSQGGQNISSLLYLACSGHIWKVRF